MEIITYYQYKQWDGRERHIAKDPCFKYKAHADLFLKTRPHDHFDKVTVTVFDSVAEFEAVSDAKIKEQALAKLTDLEKKALGLI